MKDIKYATTYWFGVADANKNGQNWKLASPKEGQTVWLDTMSISKHLKDEPEKLEAAYLLLDFMISEEVQAKILREYGSIIVNSNTASVLTPEEVKNGLVGDESFFKEEYFWKPLSARTVGVYKKLWDNALQARKDSGK